MRLSLLLALGVFSQGSAAQAPALTESERLAHVISRLTFGARPADVERVRQMGIERWISEQLTPARITDTTVVFVLRDIPSWSQPSDNAPAARAMTGAVPPPITRVDTTPDFGVRYMSISMAPSINAQFYAGKIIRAQASERQLDEVMADFWENHFSVWSGRVGPHASLLQLTRDAIRPRALGTFRDLLGAVTRSPAMLMYLDNQASTKNAPNENFARELLELHTLGVDGGYTQADVIDVARAFTGWTRTNPSSQFMSMARAFYFDPAVHDSGAKTILGVRFQDARGIDDGEQVLDIIARHPSTARFISTKLARKFVSDDPPPALVDRAAATFAQTGGNIAEVLRTIITSPEFFARDAFRAKVKTPFELVVSARRALDLAADTSGAMPTALTDLGQTMWGRISPDGWPDRADAWINAGAVLKRVLFATDLAEGKFAQTRIEDWREWPGLVAASNQEQVAIIVRALLNGTVSAETRSALAATPGSGEERARAMVAMGIGSPEFQRR